MQTSFKSTLWQDGNNTGIEIPEQNVLELGSGKRPPVLVEVNGYQYPSTVASYSGQYLVPFAKAHRDATGLKGGDPIDVTLTLDSAPRTFDLPDDAREAVENAGLLSTYKQLAPSHQKEYVRSIEEAKKPETRASRISKMIEKLGGDP